MLYKLALNSESFVTLFFDTAPTDVCFSAFLKLFLNVVCDFKKFETWLVEGVGRWC